MGFFSSVASKAKSVFSGASRAVSSAASGVKNVVSRNPVAKAARGIWSHTPSSVKTGAKIAGNVALFAIPGGAIARGASVAGKAAPSLFRGVGSVAGKARSLFAAGAKSKVAKTAAGVAGTGAAVGIGASAAGKGISNLGEGFRRGTGLNLLPFLLVGVGIYVFMKARG